MNFFPLYIKGKKRSILIFLAFSLIFITSFLLYHLPIEAVLYPVLLCGLFGIIYLIIDYFRIKRKHQSLLHRKHLIDVMTTSFPPIEYMEDYDYQQIIQSISKEHTNYVNETKHRYLDMMDYYTLWVHQIKTPIASMRLKLQNEDSTLSRSLSGDLFRIEQYVEMVLTFLRLDSDSTDYVIKEYDLDSIIKHSVKKYAGEFIQRKISLSYEPVQAKVLTDEKWLSFVIEQLLSNALKYTHRGGISITYDAEDKLYISDTGIGIAPEDLPRIFENGYTGYNGRTDKKASGIGLYLCKRICSNLNHSIIARSKIGEGTTIIIDLSRNSMEIE